MVRVVLFAMLAAGFGSGCPCAESTSTAQKQPTSEIQLKTPVLSSHGPSLDPRIVMPETSDTPDPHMALRRARP